ncbi:AbrB/MazE/SpoVT family DNA-binding domain-containing protein [Patescibacteria group bacterium]|nr:AbrB/MazE/SpoVT family DNA-binding domain-containing protein [Patescibacteria group bacterium]MBU1896049.1 AbrB/MazE/SpoVT family DNA-binding domain-containing protein [Patescibacteria group bacterium]
MNTIVKATTKGQITIPAKWRNRFNTDRFLVNIKDTHLEIKPINLDNIDERQEYTVFDAIRDNKGKGIKAKDLVKILKKTI